MIVSIQLLIALAPPLKWDALTDHLELPRRYLAAGGIIFLPDQPLWGEPQLVEMNYTWALNLFNLSTPTTLNWIIGILFILGLQGVVARLTNQTASWMAVAALLVGVTTRGLLRWGYVDLFSAFYGLAILILLIEMGYYFKVKSTFAAAILNPVA